MAYALNYSLDWFAMWQLTRHEMLRMDGLHKKYTLGIPSCRGRSPHWGATGSAKNAYGVCRR